MRYRHHIFVCTNQRPEGKESCGEAAGLALVDAFKTTLRDRGIRDVRAQRAGCLDLCKDGPAAMVYPQGTCYGHLTPADAVRIVDEHIVGGVPVEDKALPY